jgi:excisionase family DNA binding protein
MRVLSQCSTGLGRHARRKGAGGAGKHSLVVLTYDEAAEITGVARRTIERLIAVGEGPAVIELSSRRRGILETDLRVWLQRRRRSPSGEARSPPL